MCPDLFRCVPIDVRCLRLRTVFTFVNGVSPIMHGALHTIVESATGVLACFAVSKWFNAKNYVCGPGGGNGSPQHGTWGGMMQDGHGWVQGSGSQEIHSRLVCSATAGADGACLRLVSQSVLILTFPLGVDIPMPVQPKAHDHVCGRTLGERTAMRRRDLRRTGLNTGTGK